MAVINKDNPNMDFPLQISRQYGAPLDKSTLFYSFEEAQEYAYNSPLAYFGQIISVFDDGDMSGTVYKIDDAGDLIKLMDETDVTNAINNAIISTLNKPV